jgi:2-oxoglutarate/2-oxoacid ferredoxin oxidoreductase subunit alpha
MAASDIEDCFYSVITARKIAETFNTVVVVLSDASLASAQQPFPRPRLSPDWHCPPWIRARSRTARSLRLGRQRTGIARRFVPGSARRHAHPDRPGAQPQPARSRTTARANQEA